MVASRKSFPVMLSVIDHTVEDKDNTNSNHSPPSFANSEWDDDVEDNVDSVNKDHLQEAPSNWVDSIRISLSRDLRVRTLACFYERIFKF